MIFWYNLSYFYFLSITGTEYPLECSNGTYSNQTGLSDIDQCTDCTEGYYCESWGLTAPTGLCRAGEFVFFSRSWARLPAQLCLLTQINLESNMQIDVIYLWPNTFRIFRTCDVWQELKIHTWMRLGVPGQWFIAYVSWIVFHLFHLASTLNMCVAKIQT